MKLSPVTLKKADEFTMNNKSDVQLQMLNIVDCFQLEFNIILPPLKRLEERLIILENGVILFFLTIACIVFISNGHNIFNFELSGIYSDDSSHPFKVSSQLRKSEFRVFSIVHLSIYNF